MPKLTVATPQILLPVAGYRTSSHIIRFRSDDNPQADSTLIEISQGGNVVYTGSAAAGVSWHTLPGGSVGNFSVRARNIKSGVHSAYSSAVSFTIEDYASATQVYNQNYAAASGCGDSTEPFGVRFFFCSADAHWSVLCSGWASGGGNMWTCDTADALGVNNSGSGLYSANNGIYTQSSANEGSITGTGYLQNSSGTNDGLSMSCRDANDGQNNHYAMWLYPNRDAASADNLVLVRHDNTNTNTTLATGRFAELQNKGAGMGNAVTLRFDCLGSHITAYYQTAGSFKPMLSVSDSTFPGNPAFSFMALGVGPGGVTQLHTRMTMLTIKKYP
ncbi:MAG: hypothetical protein KF713_09410 [Turneriella sp.]|nr:hypothetical protein [Turneriella sp.]